MNERTLSDWLKQKNSVDNEVFYKALSLKEKINRKAVGCKEAKEKRKKGIPEADMGMLGVGRTYGMARITGDFIELYASSHSTPIGKGGRNTTPIDRDKDGYESTRKRISHKCAKRAEKAIRRLVNTNRLRYMWTCTFAPPSEKNSRLFDCLSLDEQKNIAVVKRRFRSLTQKISRRHTGWKWLVIFELHSSKETSESKLNTWHIHFATDVWIAWDWLNRKWTHGYCEVEDFQKPLPGKRRKSVRNPGAYMSKYVGKSFDETNLHVKRYSRSRNMQLPEIIDLSEFMEMFPGFGNLKMVFRTHRVNEAEGQRFFISNITFKKESNYEHNYHNRTNRRSARTIPDATTSKNTTR